jgi:hypothetical protein
VVRVVVAVDDILDGLPGHRANSSEQGLCALYSEVGIKDEDSAVEHDHARVGNANAAGHDHVRENAVSKVNPLVRIYRQAHDR